MTDNAWCLVLAGVWIGVGSIGVADALWQAWNQGK